MLGGGYPTEEYNLYRKEYDNYCSSLTKSDVPYKIPTTPDKIPLWLVYQIGLLIATQMAKIVSIEEDAEAAKDKAKLEAKKLATKHNVEHLINWDSFIQL